jgi:hypothetical protein
VLLKYTYFGDTDVNGKVDGGDYARTDNGFNMQIAGSWTDGDFNYDGPVDGADYALIDNAFIMQGGVLGGSATPAAMIATPMAASAATPKAAAGTFRARSNFTPAKGIFADDSLFDDGKSHAKRHGASLAEILA